MRRSNRELWLAFTTILLITLLYLFVMYFFEAVPPASGFFGHSLGIFGFILMLFTETLYSIRKRSRSARWGRMSTWLQFHIFTGLVGPFMVLLHTSWEFNGLAGVVTLLTIITVISGVIGRYIYTAVPRTPDGIEIETQDLNDQIRALEREMQALTAASSQSIQELARRMDTLPRPSGSSIGTVLGRAYYKRRFQRQWRSEQRKLGNAAAAQAKQIQKYFDRRNALKIQLDTIAAARRLLALWHAVHIPIGIALFISAFVHIAGALYYATFLH